VPKASSVKIKKPTAKPLSIKYSPGPVHAPLIPAATQSPNIISPDLLIPDVKLTSDKVKGKALPISPNWYDWGVTDNHGYPGTTTDDIAWSDALNEAGAEPVTGYNPVVIEDYFPGKNPTAPGASKPVDGALFGPTSRAKAVDDTPGKLRSVASEDRIPGKNGELPGVVGSGEWPAVVRPHVNSPSFKAAHFNPPIDPAHVSPPYVNTPHIDTSYIDPLPTNLPRINSPLSNTTTILGGNTGIVPPSPSNLLVGLAPASASNALPPAPYIPLSPIQPLNTVPLPSSPASSIWDAPGGNLQNELLALANSLPSSPAVAVVNPIETTIVPTAPDLSFPSALPAVENVATTPPTAPDLPLTPGLEKADTSQAMGSLLGFLDEKTKKSLFNLLAAPIAPNDVIGRQEEVSPGEEEDDATAGVFPKTQPDYEAPYGPISPDHPLAIGGFKKTPGTGLLDTNTPPAVDESEMTVILPDLPLT
jgi:hypothetical protein